MTSAHLDEIVFAAADATAITVDLSTQTVNTEGGRTWTFDVLSAAKESLLLGLDDIELALADAPLIAAWQEHDRVVRPWIWATTRRQ